MTAQTTMIQSGDSLIFSFLALTRAENENAGFLPGLITYRQTVKIRLLYPFSPPPITSLACLTPGTGKALSLRLQFGCSDKNGRAFTVRCSAYNGRILNLRPWQWQSRDCFNADSSFTLQISGQPKGVWAEVWAAAPLLAGSNDHTIVTVSSGEEAFSFNCRDVQKGPVYVPAFDVCISLAADSSGLETGCRKQGMTVRERILLEPEQTSERSQSEIPALNPVVRDVRGIGDRLYLPLSADRHWQKFALEWGGNFFLSKKYVRAQGKELSRCQWPGDLLRWQIGTGTPPRYDRDTSTCEAAVLHGYLPVVINRWAQEGLTFEEQAFATLLHSPLAPADPGRDESSPAFLMIRLRVANPELIAHQAEIRLRADPLDHLCWENGNLLQQQEGRKYLRMALRLPESATARIIESEQTGPAQNTLLIRLILAAGEHQDVFLTVPFVSDLPAAQAAHWAEVEFESEKQRVIDYWRELIGRYVIYTVPEQKFNDLARAVLAHLFLSGWKDPASGLYMLPAASLRYLVYANESCFQILLLDLLGAHAAATDYLQTFMQLQGSRPLPGDFVGSQQAVYFGVKIDSVYDYTASPYNLHHGTVLWTLAHHYLVTRDRSWLKRASSSMLRAADWIIQQRRLSQITIGDDRAVHYGLLPAGRLEDNRDWNYWFSVNAYACLGLEETARAFQSAGLPHAERLQREAESYRQDLRRAVKISTQRSPVVLLRDHTWSPHVPTAAGQRFRAFDLKSDYFARYDPSIKPMLRLSATREILYGPMILLNTGIIAADEPMADWILDDWEDNLTLSSSLGLAVHGWVDDDKWFSRGGMVFQANLQNPIQVYLMRREVPAAIRSLYNSMASCLYPDVNVFTEEYRTWIHGSGPFYKTPDEARFIHRVCDLLVMEHEDQIWLASGTPRRWLEPGNRIELRRARTTYGEVSFVIQPGEKALSILATVTASWHEPPKQVRLYVRSPLSGKMARVKINGREWGNWDAEQELVYLPLAEKICNIMIEFRKADE